MVCSSALPHLDRLVLSRFILLVIVAAAAGSVACSSTDLSVSAPSSTKCQVSIDSSVPMAPATGTAGTLTVTTTRDCTWSASSNAAWLQLPDATSGQGSGEVSYRVNANVDPSVRRATLSVNDAQVQIAQEAAACRFTVTPTTGTVGATGGSLSIRVDTASAACGWTAASSDSWLKVGTASQSGSATMQLTAEPNAGPARTGSALIAGQTVRIEQAAAPTPTPGPEPTPTPTPTPTPIPTPGPTPAPATCSFTVAPLQVAVAAAGGTGAVTISTTASCAWTASSDSSWLTLSSATSGVGNGTVAFIVAPSLSLSARTGTLTVAGQGVVVTQGAAPTPTPQTCTYSIAPTSATIGPAATTISVAVTTQAGCAWREEQNDPWLELGAVSSGTGSGTAQVDVQRYKGNSQRTGTMTIGGQTFTVTQTK